MNVKSGTVSIAPLGTAPGAEGAWTAIGHTDGFLGLTPAADSTEPLIWPMPTSITVTVRLDPWLKVMPGLYAPPPCQDTIQSIRAHGQILRATRILAAGLAAPARLPCPNVF
ncbi:hypothetical protein HFP70_35760 [Streptomyces sp. ARC14]|uniref:hypothetical protein n=1 Tax=Streptomyces sp. ARC14 TaxID=2724152 RepID=UPI00385746C7